MALTEHTNVGHRCCGADEMLQVLAVHVMPAYWE